MHNTVKVPKALIKRPIIVDCIEAQAGDRVRQQQLLASLQVGNEIVSVVAPCDGWIRFSAIKEQVQVKPGDALFIIDSMPAEDYEVDSEEVNGLTELGQNGRRNSARDGQSQYVEAYSQPLVEAAQAQQGNAHRSVSGVEPHELLSKAKEGVPLKQSMIASENERAQDRLNNDPELQNTLGNELKARYAKQSTLSSAPTLKA